MSQTRQLAQFCHGLKYDEMPAEVIEKAKLCILDFVANVYGSLELDAAKAVAEYVKTIDAKGKATVLGCGYASNAHHAAFVNGTLAEAIEAQDGLRFGGNHPGTAVIPAALAIAEETGAGGKAVIEAVVAGYEAADRAAAAVHPWSTLSGFFAHRHLRHLRRGRGCGPALGLRSGADAQRHGRRGVHGPHLHG